MSEVIVVGGGASGLMAAYSAAINGNDVTLLEASERVGRKISASGNGKCNITNSFVSAKYYNSSKLVKIVEKINFQALSAQLTSMGLILSNADDEGRVYPVTYNSNSVVDVLRMRCNEVGVKLVTSCIVDCVTNIDTKVKLLTTNGNMMCDKAILCLGSNAQMKSYNAQQLVDKKYWTKLSPSITSINTVCDKSVHGQRVKAMTTLSFNGKQIAIERGEVMFKDNELSGIAIFNLSAYIARNIVNGIVGNYTISLNLFEQYSASELEEILLGRLIYNGSIDSYFAGILTPKLAQWITRILGISRVERSDITKLVKLLQCFTFEVSGLGDYTHSQIIAGGIADEYVGDDFTFLPLKNVYMCGEMLNVDGMCGGYNLHFALASGMEVGRKI